MGYFAPKNILPYVEKARPLSRCRHWVYYSQWLCRQLKPRVLRVVVYCFEAKQDNRYWENNTNPEKLPLISGHICVAEYPVHILGAELKATGFPYMSQDTDVTVCAPAAC